MGLSKRRLQLLLDHDFHAEAMDLEARPSHALDDGPSSTRPRLQLIRKSEAVAFTRKKLDWFSSVMVQ